MGKQPTTGQKKTKDSISKAATSSKKGGHKKWTKGKAKEKVDNACFLDVATYEKLMGAIPKLGKHISLSSVVDKFKVQSSIARVLLRKL
jgi:small subunit ribosomal protein S25e